MKRALIVDDHDLLRRLLSRLLSQRGFETDTATDGVKAEEMLRNKGPYALMVTDIIMPEREGIETIMGAKERYPGLKIIAISGGGRGSAQDYLGVARIVGADLCLRKPFTADEWNAALDEVLGAD